MNIGSLVRVSEKKIYFDYIVRYESYLVRELEKVRVVNRSDVIKRG